MTALATVPVGTGTRWTCSSACASRDEPLEGTASRAARWLLVQQPGPWGPEGLPSSGLDDGVRDRLKERAAAQGARVLLIRRPGRVTDEHKATRRVVLVDVRPGVESAVETDLAWVDGGGADLAEAELPWPHPDVEPPAGWRRVTAPLWLVCTQGRHDVCCATRGRPVAAAFAAADPDGTWECSHLGGDRFAANVLALPTGLFLGRVQAEQVPDVVADVAARRLPRTLLRGRACYAPVVQVAQHLAGVELDLHGLDDLRALQVAHDGADLWRVTLAGPDGPVDAVVEQGLGPVAEKLTCDAARPSRPPTYRLRELAPAA